MKFLIVALSFYGMSTFEGPMMALKSVNALSHYTDWTVGHVHSGALGWAGMISIGSFYYLIPKLWNTQIHSVRLINVHFWLATTGTLLYIVAMWISGITQGLMWRAFDDYGNLMYRFAESVAAMHPLYAMRALGGAFYVSGMLLMIYNVYKTVSQAKAAESLARA